MGKGGRGEDMSTNKPVGGVQFTPVCTCQAVREYYDTGIGGMFEDKVRLCPFHAAAPAMYDRHKDNYGMVQEALRFLYEGEHEEVKCLLNHIALNSKKAVKQAEGR